MLNLFINNSSPLQNPIRSPKTHGHFGSNCLKLAFLQFVSLFKKMAHKKLFLGKFLGESSSSSDSRSSRSLIHDGTNWYIPETTTTTSENEMVEDPGDKPNQSGSGNRPIQSGACNIPIESGAEEESKGSGKNFYTDNSSISPPTSKSEASDKTVPFLGTSAHPITATGSSSLSTEDLDNIPIRTPP